MRRRELITMVTVRYCMDPHTGLPQIYRHDVSEMEVHQVFERPAEDRPGNEGARVAIGYTSTDRTLRLIYASGPQRNAVLVITAHDLTGKPLLAHRWRRRRKLQ